MEVDHVFVTIDLIKRGWWREAERKVYLVLFNLRGFGEEMSWKLCVTVLVSLLSLTDYTSFLSVSPSTQSFRVVSSEVAKTITVPTHTYTSSLSLIRMMSVLCAWRQFHSTDNWFRGIVPVALDFESSNTNTNNTHTHTHISQVVQKPFPYLQFLVPLLFQPATHVMSPALFSVLSFPFKMGEKGHSQTN